MDDKKQKLLSLFPLLRKANVTSKYTTPAAIKELIVLSDAGKLFMEEMKKRLPDESENSLYYGFLLDMYHQEFWIDSERTNVDAIVDLFDHLFYSGALQVPWMFGRDLYDKYYRLFTEQKEVLDEAETADLLQNSPCGVAQVGNLVVGPFGIISGAQTLRPIFPTTIVPLWHCMDLGCEKLHAVELKLNRIPELTVADAINDAAVELLGEGIDWGSRLKSTLPYQSNYYDADSVNDIAALLVTCLSSVELKTLCSTLLVENSAYVRSKVKQRGATASLFKNTGPVIASKLSRDQCLQLILTLSDKVIIDTLERLISEKVIVIPHAEIRTACLGGQGPAGWLGMYSELSQFGFRRVARAFPDITLAIARLRKLVLDFYEDRKIPESHLLHLLRFSQGNSARQKLDDYINKTDPRAVIKDLISTHDKGLVECVSYLRFGYAPILRCLDDEVLLIDKILWKLGFSVPVHSSELRTFEIRLDALLASSREITNSSESERERTRSAAVNLFVSLEELLDRTLSYSSWLFLSDHFGGSRFRFRLTDGRAIAAKHLSGKKIGDGRLELGKDGKNTLFPLIEGLKVLAAHIAGLRQKSSKKFVRKNEDEPGYAAKNPLEKFPFLHTVFLYDISEDDIAACAHVLSDASTALHTGKICEVRNKLEHKREDFPSRDEIEVCCDAISRAIKSLVAAGLCPVDYYLVETKTDRYGRVVDVFENYSGHRTSINSFPRHLLSYTPPGNGPIAITPLVHIGDSADVFYADIVNISEYVEMWKDYPKRREDASSVVPKASSNSAPVS